MVANFHHVTTKEIVWLNGLKDFELQDLKKTP
jgi:hypothetical protein